MAEVALAPRVHQAVGRAGIEPTYDALLREQGEIGDTTQIKHRAVFRVRMQGRGVEGRDQGCTVTARGDIAAPEFGDDAHAAALGDRGRVPQLQRERNFTMWAVAQGLAMRADRTHLVGVDACCLHGGTRGLRECTTDPDVQFTHFIQGQ